MEKVCYVCGHKIGPKEQYYNIGQNSYVCHNINCFNFYFWDNLATRMVNNPYHEYAIINRKVYEIGSDKDDPRGFGGQHFTIKFHDGTVIDTNSIWLRGDLPKRLQHDFPDNAEFIHG